MEIYILYTIIFITGTLLGSFFTLAIHRIPNRENIIYKRSYCPKCNHKLGFLDLVPVFSYIKLKGKCRYCKEKISPKYIVIELVSGFIFLLFAISININVSYFSIYKTIYLLLGSIYISTLFIIAGIDRKTRNISKGILLFGLIVQTMYIIYLYILNVNIYKYIIYLFAMLVFIIIETIYLKKKGKTTYSIQLLTLCIYIVMWVSEDLAILSIIITLWIIGVEQMMKKPKKDIVDVQINNNIPIASWLCFSSIALFVIESFLK